MDEVSSSIVNFEKDTEWFYKNIDRLRKENFVNKYVAIKGGKIIFSDKDIDVVIEKVRKLGYDPSLLAIQFVYPKDVVLRI